MRNINVVTFSLALVVVGYFGWVLFTTEHAITLEMAHRIGLIIMCGCGFIALGFTLTMFYSRH